MSNFYFDLSLKLSQGEAHDFSGKLQKFSEEVQNDLRGGTHLPSKSGHGFKHDIKIPDVFFTSYIVFFFFRDPHMTSNERLTHSLTL